MTKPSMKNERPPAELVALAAWVNVSSPENLPKKMRAPSDPYTMAAWQRVSEALIQYQNQTLAAERDALKAEVERLQSMNELMRAQLDSLPPPEPGLLKRQLRKVADKRARAAIRAEAGD